jgi:hypothetical protein
MAGKLLFLRFNLCWLNDIASRMAGSYIGAMRWTAPLRTRYVEHFDRHQRRRVNSEMTD